MHIASLILGIIALITCFIPFFGAAVAFIALIIAIAAMFIKRPDNSGKGMKIAGLVLSIIAFIVSLLITGAIFLGAKYLVDNGEEIMQNLNQSINQEINDAVLASDLSNVKNACALAYATALDKALNMGFFDGTARDEDGNVVTAEYYYNEILNKGFGEDLSELKAKYIIIVDQNGIPTVTLNEEGATEDTTDNNDGSNTEQIEDSIINNIKDNIQNIVDKGFENDTKQYLKKAELEKIEEFVNKVENNPFAIKTYSNPQDLFNNKNSQPTSYYLKYAIQLSEYSKKLTDDQLEQIYGEEKPPVTVYGTSVDNVIKFLKEKMNYNYSIQTLKSNASTYINEKTNMFITMVSDTIMSPLKITSGYTDNGKIYVKTSLNFTITLTENNGNYYFYASEGLAW